MVPGSHRNGYFVYLLPILTKNKSEVILLRNIYNFEFLKISDQFLYESINNTKTFSTNCLFK